MALSSKIQRSTALERATTLEPRKHATRKGSTYERLPEEVLDDEVLVRALTIEVTLQLKNLNEVTDEWEVAVALKTQWRVDVAMKAVRLRKHSAGTPDSGQLAPISGY